MAYTKQTWQCGDSITADKLNHMEDGIASGGGSALVVQLIEGEMPTCSPGCIPKSEKHLDKTWQEIKDAYDAGIPVYMQYATTYTDEFGSTIDYFRYTLIALEESTLDNSTQYFVFFTNAQDHIQGIASTSTDTIVVAESDCECGGM